VTNALAYYGTDLIVACKTLCCFGSLMNRFCNLHSLFVFKKYEQQGRIKQGFNKKISDSFFVKSEACKGFDI